MLCLSGFELYSRWVPLFCGAVVMKVMDQQTLVKRR